jgi:hypothetical protein
MAQTAPVGSGTNAHWDVGIRSAENGAVINISHESGGRKNKYTSKTLVAPSPRAAFRVAAAHLPALVKKAGKGKKAARKKVSAKKA